MKRLLWKEYRERRLWALPLAAAVVGVVAAGRGYTYCGEAATFTAWIIPSPLVALLLGMSAYSGELAWGTPDFLHSRPISWKRVLAAKLIFGLGLIAAVAILGAIAFRFAAPEPYRRFATITGLAPGVGIAILLMGVPYLVGFCCSVVFPGMVGAILMFVALGSAAAGMGILLDQLERSGHSSYLLAGLAWVLAPPLAALFVLRFGLTLSIARRVKRYVFAAAVVIVALTAADAITHWDPFTPARRADTRLSISPDGEYALVIKARSRLTTNRGPEWESGTVSIVRLADNHRAIAIRSDMRHIPDLREFGAWWHAGCLYWAPNGTAYRTETEVTVEKNGKRYGIPTLRMTRSGRAQCGIIPGRLVSPHVVKGRFVGYYGIDDMLPSPDGRIAALMFSRYPKDYWLNFVDIERRRILPVEVRGLRRVEDTGGHVATWWWQSNTEIGYLDANGRRRIVRVAQ